MFKESGEQARTSRASSACKPLGRQAERVGTQAFGKPDGPRWSFCDPLPRCTGAALARPCAPRHSHIHVHQRAREGAIWQATQLHPAELQCAIPGRDANFRSRPKLTPQDALGERILHLLLDRALERPGSINGVETGFGQQIAGRII